MSSQQPAQFSEPTQPSKPAQPSEPTRPAPVARVNPPTLARPSGFTHAVRHEGLIHLSGQTAMDSAGAIVPGGIVEQFAQALDNLLTALRAAGGDPAYLLSVIVYLTDIPGYQRHGREIGEVWRAKAGRDYPAMTGIGVTSLWQPEALVEIAGTAAVPPSR
jgi:enamine deaminase RidA (YjgF/YER057c/UK114 family)